jgi:hypothetical protein
VTMGLSLLLSSIAIIAGGRASPNGLTRRAETRWRTTRR